MSVNDLEEILLKQSNIRISSNFPNDPYNIENESEPQTLPMTETNDRIIFKVLKRKRGRKIKNEKNDDNIYKHDKYASNNAIRRIFHSCNKNTHQYINSKLKNKKILMPTICHQLGHNKKEYKQFFDMKYYDIIVKTIPKRYEKQKAQKKLTDEEKENIYKINKIKLDEILDNNPNIRLILNIKFGDFLEAYITDKKINKTSLNLEGFTTYKNCLNEVYDDTQKKHFKNILIKKYMKNEQK